MRTAFITGAGSGIGAATAERLAQKGWRLALVDLDEAAAQATAARCGSEAAAFGADNQLWASDGTAAGTRLAYDYGTAVPSTLTGTGNALTGVTTLFLAATTGGTATLWAHTLQPVYTLTPGTNLGLGLTITPLVTEGDDTVTTGDASDAGPVGPGGDPGRRASDKGK